MKYLGSDAAADGWTFAGLAAGRFVVADGPDTAGLLFKPATVRLDESEMRVAAASAARARNNPAGEREQVGGFWDEWVLSGDGTFSRRDTQARTKKPPTGDT